MAQTHEVRGVATSVSSSNGTTSVRYHGTEVFKLTADSITLDTGGWWTATTKLRMNQAFNQFGLPWSVYQERGKWYAWNRISGLKVPFDRPQIVLPQSEEPEPVCRIDRPNPPQERYNGWTNYDTWNVALWVGNEEPWYRAMMAAGGRNQDFTADSAEAFARDLWPSGKTPDSAELDTVNWQEIADSWNEA